MQVRRLHARAARTNSLRGQDALEEIHSRIGTAASRDAVIGLEQGRISRSRQPDTTTSRWRPWPDPRFRTFRVVQHEWEETGMHLRYLRARHPEIAGGNVHHVQAVSSRITPSPVSLPGRTEPCSYYTSYYSSVPGTQKALSLPGKGPGLRKLVRSSRLGLTLANGVWLECCPQVKRALPTRSGGCRSASAGWRPVPASGRSA